jgi:hypothetical protein
LEQLQSANRGNQLRAAKALAGAPEALRPQIAPKLIPLLASERENDRFVAAQTLGEYGPAARAAVLPLLPVLEGTQFERNRAAAAKALGQILKDAPPAEDVEQAVQGLIGVFTDKYSDVRREAVQACGMIGPAAKACIPHLPRMFDDAKYGGIGERDERYLVHAAAAWTAGRMGPLAACHIDRLIAILHGQEITTTAVWAIGEIGPVHENVIPNLTDRLEKAVYGQWGGFRVGARSFRVGVIVEGTQQEFRDFCFNVLAKFGAKSKSAIPLMIRLISEGEVTGGKSICNSIGAMKVLRVLGPEAKESLPALEKATQITRFDHRVPAATVAAFKAEARAALATVKGEAVPMKKKDIE